jgi:hypothetical protein
LGMKTSAPTSSPQCEHPVGWPPKLGHQASGIDRLTSRGAAGGRDTASRPDKRGCRVGGLLISETGGWVPNWGTMALRTHRSKRATTGIFCAVQAGVHPADSPPTGAAARCAGVRLKYWAGLARCWGAVPHYLTLYSKSAIRVKGGVEGVEKHPDNGLHRADAPLLGRHGPAIGRAS